MDGPSLTVVLASSEASVALYGVNMQAGDECFWASTSASSCETQGVDTYVIKSEGGGLTGRFYFGGEVGTLQLCYRFNYQSAGLPSDPTPFLLFSTVRVVSVGTLSASPTGSALQCAALVTIAGSGFTAANSETAQCLFGSFGASNVTYISDTQVQCRAPTVAHEGVTALQLRFTDRVDAPLLLVHGTFTFYDASQLYVSAAMPDAGPYDQTTAVELKGGFLDFGAPACRFGGFVSESATVFDDNLASCSKPILPASERTRLGAYAIDFSPDSQCWVSTGLNYTTYNAMVDSLSLTGAPSASSVTLAVFGSGFVSLESARCKFTTEGPPLMTRYTAITKSSSTEAVCSSPAAGLVATYEVGVQFNGVNDDPYLDPASIPTFTGYNLSSVTLSALTPSNGPQGVATSITIEGLGFASYGTNQLLCRAGFTLIPAQLLDETKITCELPSTLPVGTIDVSVSLNAGENGTFTHSLDFFVYQQPALYGVSVNENATGRRALGAVPIGSSVGGTLVVITGIGFEALPSALRDVQCRFGGLGSPTSRGRVLSNEQVECYTTWGLETEEGQPVGVALNGVSFVSSVLVVFYFVGTHPPHVVDVHFTQDARLLVIQLDEQPTDRGRVNGNVGCEELLSVETAATLRGSSPAPTTCGWSDDSTIVAYLTVHTDAGPGMIVTLNANTIKPKFYHGDCATGTVENMCNDAMSARVDDFFPCDKASTAALERCHKPVAMLVAPRTISMCPGTPLELDGSYSTGGGAKRLDFAWAATGDTDNRRVIVTYLKEASGQS